jgi:hypothetical protein
LSPTPKNEDGKKRPKNRVLVNWRNGGAWKNDGTPFAGKSYGVIATSDTGGNWRVESVDKDPRYWSPSGIDYTADGGSAHDSPGIPSHGLYQMKFKVCIYHDDVPGFVTGDENTGGMICSKAVKCIDWEASTLWKVNQITHPAFWRRLSGGN